MLIPAVTVLVTLGLVNEPGFTALAKDLDEYATWDDVVAAQGDVDAQNALIDEINAQIDQLNSDVAEAEILAQQAGDRYNDAEQAATAQSEVVYGLQVQVDEAEELATEAETTAGEIVAAMNGRVTLDPTIALLMSPGDADDFLMGMSTLSSLGMTNGMQYEEATAARNNANQLQEQADTALEELETLEAEAQAEYDSAVAAQLDLQEKRDAAVNEGAELEAMLIPLQEHRDVVQADYEVGEQLREEERQRQEQERAEAAAAAAAAAQGSTSDVSAVDPSGSSASSSGATAASGYAYPIATNAYVTSLYGMRLHPIYNYWRLHAGTDLVVPSGTCWTPLYAVTSGTVTYAGWMDGWGYIVMFRAGDGTVFRYPHISEGGINVYPGQQVSAGQTIAYAGTTGPSTGCHLHFQVEINGSPVDSDAWLINHGLWFSGL